MVDQSFSTRRGAQLAIAMLDELEGDMDLCERCVIEAPVLEGVPQQNIVRQYLERATAGGSEVLDGFTLVLSCFVASVTSGTCPDADFYRKRFERNRSLAGVLARDGYQTRRESGDGKH